MGRAPVLALGCSTSLVPSAVPRERQRGAAYQSVALPLHAPPRARCTSPAPPGGRPQGSMNHSGGLINMTAGARALFTGKYDDEDDVDFMAGADALRSHKVGGAGMESAGNISFKLSKTVFAGSLKSNGTTALLESANASVTFGSFLDADADDLVAAADGDNALGSMFARRLLQTEDGAQTEHLVGGLGFRSKGTAPCAVGCRVPPGLSRDQLHPVSAAVGPNCCCSRPTWRTLVASVLMYCGLPRTSSCTLATPFCGTEEVTTRSHSPHASCRILQDVRGTGDGCGPFSEQTRLDATCHRNMFW